jgi:hypothetical protein
LKSILLFILLVASALAWAEAPSGKWTGSAAPNLGQTERCQPTMKYELVVENGKLKGKLDFGVSEFDIAADVAPDGKFETTFINRFGHTMIVSGKLDESFTVNYPIRCGWGNIPLKR